MDVINKGNCLNNAEHELHKCGCKLYSLKFDCFMQYLSHCSFFRHVLVPEEFVNVISAVV